MQYVKSEHQEINVETNRDLYIGGSDLPSILRLNAQYGTSLMQFAKEKLKIIPTAFQGNEYTRYGQFMEPFVRNYINEMFNYNFKEDSIIDKTRMYRGNCDGLDKIKKTLLEVKTFGSKLDIKLYEPQCQFYMELFDVEECLLVGYKRPREFYGGISYDIEKDAEYFDLTFDESNIVIYKIKRDREMFAYLETEINKFKYLLTALREEVILNGKGE